MKIEDEALQYIKTASDLLGGNFNVFSVYTNKNKKEGRKIVIEYEKIEENDEKEGYNKIPSRY